MTRFVEVRTGAYQDSVTLMQISHDLGERTGVTTASVAMATELNLGLLAQMGFEVPTGVTPNDLVVAIDADDDAGVAGAVEALEVAMTRRSMPSGLAASDVPPAPTIAAAARRVEASLALVSTPGRVAAIDAADALSVGLDVMIFSDNVTVEHEVALKALAAASGLLVMGPDCGTAVIAGVGLGFANVVRPGPVGIVAASGTGAQHLLALLDGIDLGVKHCVGVGGRDLSVQVGGSSTIAALDRLGADEDVQTVVVISKPPAAAVAARVTAHADSLGKRTVFCYLGPDQPDITTTAHRIADAAGVAWKPPRRWGGDTPPHRRGFVRGLFVGGTLCDEAMLLTAAAVGSVASNIPLAGQPRLGKDLRSAGHTFIDFGDDQLTAGRPHPMIDPSLRLQRLRDEVTAEDCAVVLIDVVLGHGAHADPAADLVSVISAASTPVFVSLIGTRDDPQGLDDTAQRLAEAGAIVHASNAAATREALLVVEALR